MIGQPTRRIAVRAQAKLNLWLRILGREDSGYHSIETLFHRIELADDVVVTLVPNDRRVTCSEDVGPSEHNLAHRAALLYCDEQHWATGFHIDITKRIPMGGGLGGGSADAAATLLALDAMSPSPARAERLIELGGQIGADVPFLLTKAPAALAWGRGDRMLELPALPQRHVALVIPPFGISTAEAYGSLPGSGAGAAAVGGSDLGSWGAIAWRARNDLSRSGAAAAHPALRTATAALRAAGATIAEMTGSGSVLFGIFDSKPDADALSAATGWKVLLTRTALNVEAPAGLE